MKRLREVILAPNIEAGYLYFYVHFITELVCFYFLQKIIGTNPYLWLIPLIYDALAFVPQSVIGYVSDKHPQMSLGIIGTFLLIFALITFPFRKYVSLIVLCLGNACIHVNGAEVTLRASKGKLSHSAIFVAGGSFGVITGKILGSTSLSRIFIIVLALTMLPCIIYAEDYRKDADKTVCPCKNFNYNSEDITPSLLIMLTLVIIICRGYMGYGIPTSWNKTLFQTIMLYVTMGIGKALGGILADLIGVKKIAYISVIFALPFLIIGNNHMLISLIGVMAFSMTMAITLGLLVSVLKNTPGLAFGLTTIGLFLGTLPIFFIKVNSYLYNSVLIIVLSFICLLFIRVIIREDKKNEKY